MKRRYSRRGTERAARWFTPLIAIAGLSGCLVYGVFILVPKFDTEVVPATSTQPEPTPKLISEVRAENAAAEESRTTVDSPRPDGCEAAMSAALASATIEFRSASAQLLPASLRVIEVLAALAHACPGAIVIAGHSDDLGPENFNLSISEERAAAVEQAFMDFGIDAERLTATGYGSSRPVAENTSVVGRARNRRIEMTLRERMPSQTEEQENVAVTN